MHHLENINSFAPDTWVLFGLCDFASLAVVPGRAGAGGNQAEDSDHGRLTEIRSRTYTNETRH